jgi:riboflavin synthase
MTRRSGRTFTADVSRETLGLTTLGVLTVGSAVNLEPALRAGDVLGGHLVSGHIDGMARLLGRRPEGRSERFQLELPPSLARFVAPKGSICLDGVSLTVNEVEAAAFGVNVIPHTLTATTLGNLRPGTPVNVEVDLLARYVARLAQWPA